VCVRLSESKPQLEFVASPTPRVGPSPPPGRASASPRACTPLPLRRKASYVYLVLFGGGSGGLRTAAHNAVYIQRPFGRPAASQVSRPAALNINTGHYAQSHKPLGKASSTFVMRCGVCFPQCRKASKAGFAGKGVVLASQQHSKEVSAGPPTSRQSAAEGRLILAMAYGRS